MKGDFMGRLKAMTIEECRAWAAENFKAESYFVVDENGILGVRHRIIVSDLTAEDINRMTQSVFSEELRVMVKPKPRKASPHHLADEVVDQPAKESEQHTTPGNPTI
jgi:hypothetical protein